MLLFYLSLIETEEERDLFTKLYNEHSHTMYVCAYKYLHNSSDAEDIVHDVFCMVAGDCIKTMIRRSDAECRRFLYLCTKNRAINYGKHKAKIVSIEAFEENGVDITAGLTDESFIDKISERDLIDTAIAALKNLDPIYGEVLWMSFEGFPISEIARLFNEKQATIKKRLYRGKSLLRAAVGLEGGEA